MKLLCFCSALLLLVMFYCYVSLFPNPLLPTTVHCTLLLHLVHYTLQSEHYYCTFSITHYCTLHTTTACTLSIIHFTLHTTTAPCLLHITTHFHCTLSTIYCTQPCTLSIIHYCTLLVPAPCQLPTTHCTLLLNRSSHLGIHKQINACLSIPRSQTVFIYFKICIWYAESGNHEAFVVV